MTAYLVFTAAGPVLVVSSCSSIMDERVVGFLRRRGFARFLAYEVPLECVRRAYGEPFEVIAAELATGMAARVLDYDGRHIFASVPLADLGRTYACEQ